jgi:HSP20 family protein
LTEKKSWLPYTRESKEHIAQTSDDQLRITINRSCKEDIMNLSVWDPFREMEVLLDRYSRAVRKPTEAGDSKAMEVGDWMPTVDIIENEHGFVVKTELPGVEKDDVKVHINNGLLTIRGEKKRETKDEKQHRVECAYGSFVRSFTLPQDVELEKVEAAYKNGILSLIIPKLEKAQPKQIEVKVS